ncbi:MAG: hypothetical protein KIC73_04340 [Clostridiales bacterium]|nr:hypothetical protein [Clostridiales bacterium]
MLNNLLKVTKNVISKCVKPVLESAKKAFQPQIKNLQNSTLGKAAAKLLPVVNSPAVKSGFSQVQKALALPKTVAPAKKEVASTPQSSSNNQAKQLSASSNSPAPQEENVKLLEEYKGNEASKLEDIIRGAVKSDAFRIAFNANLSMGAMPGFLKVLRVMTPPEYKSLNLKIPYELLKADIKAKFNQAGNDAYNAQVPIASNLIGAFTNSSDYKEHGPLPLETPEMNNMLAMMNYFMYGGRGGGILNQADVMSTYQNITNNTNMASVIGANAGGALIDGGAGMANSIIEIIIDPYEAEKNLFNLVTKSPVIIPALLDKAANYTKHYVTEATPQEKARVKGRIIFELASLAAFSAIGKAIKGAEAAQGAQKTEALAKTGSEVPALIDEGGVSITKTEDVLTANRGVGEVVEEGVKKGSGPGIRGSNSTVNGFDTTVNAGKQGKHIVGNNNYIEGRSIFKGTADDAQRLVDKFAGTGEWIGANKERINFGEVIGQYMNPATGEAVDTTVGIIHYSKTGTHIVPAQPIQ